MQTALLQYPFDSSIKLLKSLLVRRGYAVVSSDAEQGMIRANIPGGFLKKPQALELRVHKIDRHSTKVEIMVNENKNTYEKPRSLEDKLEERFVSSIYHYF